MTDATLSIADVSPAKAEDTISLYGWAIALICLLAQFFGNGMVAVFGVFLLPLSTEFAVGVSQMSLGMVIYILVTCLSSPLIGALLKPGRIKLIMLSGTVLMACSMLVLSRASSLLTLAGGMVMLSISFSLYGAIPSTVIISQWYERRRGRALALMAMGISIAGFTLPPLAAWLLESMGWRPALLVLGLCGSLSLLLVFLFWLQENPESLSRPLSSVGSMHKPLGQAPERDSLSGSERAELEASNRHLAKSRSFWLIGLSFGVINTTLIVFSVYFIPYLQSLGLSLVESASLLALAGASGLLGKIVIGWLADYFQGHAISLLLVLQAVLVSSWYLFGAVQSYTAMVVVLVAMMGAAQGGTVPLQPYINAQLFGVERLGKVTGLHALFLLPFVLPAVPLVGYFVDSSGSYQVLFYGGSSLYAMSLLFALWARVQKG